MAGEAKRIEVGFDGGQVMSIRMTDERLGELRGAVESGGGWHDLNTEDGTLSLDLGKVAFIRGAGGSHSVGFSGA